LVSLDGANNCLAACLDVNIADYELLWTPTAFKHLNKVSGRQRHFRGVPQVEVESFWIAGNSGSCMTLQGTVG
jgi:hypothetical protein